MHSQTIGTGIVREGTLTLTHRANAHAAKDPEQFHSSSDRSTIGQAGGVKSDGWRWLESNDAAVEDGDGSKGPAVDQSIIGYEDPIVLTQSTHSFLFTEPTCSTPFNFALLIVGISYLCLTLALVDNLSDCSSKGNQLCVPVNVKVEVRVAQYLALVIGLVMEQEIPETLYLIRMISKANLHVKEPDIKYGKFIFCAALRIIMGYLFYFNMFIVVAQATGVVDIFFDVLALQFLQQLDDIAFGLAKMDVWGKTIKRASARKCFRAEFEKLPFARRKKMSIFVKIVYVINFIFLMTGMTMITISQERGVYSCESIFVNFGNDIWEDAIVLNSTTGGIENMDLIYTYFNGQYVITGTHNRKPVYTEQNKIGLGPYKVKTGATIRYCKDERVWAFMHDSIRKDMRHGDSDCPWLLRSPETDSFDLLEVSGDWIVWTGTISKGAAFQATCNHCDSDVDCNYHGECTDDGVCICDAEEIGNIPVPFYNGLHCEFARPCIELRGEKNGIYSLRLLAGDNAWKVYGRAVYFYEGGGDNLELKGPDDDLVLLYSGSRWFGTLYHNTSGLTDEYWMQYLSEFHAFWDEAYKENFTYVVSNPTTRTDPIGVDFFKIGRRGKKYGPLGELFPLQEPPGSGAFECTVNKSSIADFILETLNP